MNSSNCSGGCIKWRKKPDKSMYYTLCQNLPTGIKGFPATAGCEILTCAMTRFWTILLLVAIAAPAVEICLNSLFFSITFSTKHSQHFKLSMCTPKNFSLSVPEMQWRQSEVIQFDTEVHKTLLLSLVTLQARFINVFPLLKLCHTSKMCDRFPIYIIFILITNNTFLLQQCQAKLQNSPQCKLICTLLNKNKFHWMHLVLFLPFPHPCLYHMRFVCYN